MRRTTSARTRTCLTDYGGFGCVEVRHAKGTAGSGPRRRTVLTSPEFEWVVDLLRFWLSPAGRARFATADRSLSMWPSERGAQLQLRSLDRSFRLVREAAGLDENLSLHALRYSYVTHQVEAGYDPAFIQEQVATATPRPPASIRTCRAISSTRRCNG